MSTVATELQRLAAIPRAELISRKGALDELLAAVQLAIPALALDSGHSAPSPELSSLAGQVLGMDERNVKAKGWSWALDSLQSLAGYALSQDETPGQGEPEAPLEFPDEAARRNLRAAQLQGQAHPIVGVVHDTSPTTE